MIMFIETDRIIYSKTQLTTETEKVFKPVLW